MAKGAVIAAAALLALVVSVGLNSSASASSTAPYCMSRAAGMIAFERITFPTGESSPEVGDVWVVNADGSNQRNLTGGDRVTKDGRPAWSPDGRTIAFVSYRSGGGIFVMSRNGSGIRKLTRDLAWDPSWSPNGRELAVASSNSPSSSRIGLVSAKGGPVRWVTHRTSEAANPSWSQDGLIVFVQYTGWRDTTVEVFVMSRDGAGRRRLTHDRSSDATPAWSPDGKAIAYHSDRGISIMKADGSGVRRLTSDRDDYGPAWSPDGRCIAFGRRGTIYIAAVSGGTPRMLMKQAGRRIDGAPSWTAQQ